MKRAWPLALLLVLGLAVVLRPGMRVETKLHPPAASDAREEAPVPVAERAETSPVEESASPEARAEAKEEAEETETVVLHWIRTLLTRQNDDGSWGEGGATLLGRPIDNVGITSLALLAFLGAGYSHLNKDEVDGRRIGDAVRAALKWLTDQKPPGTLDQALATLALSEAYGMTGSTLLKDSAQASVDALASIQAADGSWHDPVWSLFGTMALKSAEIGELQFERERYSSAVDSSRRSFESGADLVSAVGFMFAHPKDRKSALEEVLRASIPGDSAERYLWTLLAFHLGQKPKANSLDVPRTAPTVDVALDALRDCVCWNSR